MEGIELSARFALAPNSKSYCGKPSFRKALACYLRKKDSRSRAALADELRKFAAHYAYLRLIASACGLKPFDQRVAEALWIGNGLLDNVPRQSMARLIVREFSGRGKLPVGRAKKLAKGMPGGFVPHHSFHVLYLHTITGVIRPSVQNADSCRISWGRVVSIGRGRAALESQRLVKRKGKLLLEPCKRTVALSCEGIPFPGRLKRGGLVACHWGFAIMKLSKTRAARLEKCTRANIAAANLAASGTG